MMSEAVPKVNDSFWFNWSETSVKEATVNYDRAAAAVQTLAAWAWGIHTSATAIGFALADKRLPLSITVTIALGSVLLLTLYWCSVWVQAPPPVEFDPRVPADIMAAYTIIIATKRRRLQFTKAVSLIAAATVAVGLLAASMPAAPKPVTGVLDTAITRHNGKRTLLVSVAGLPAHQADKPLPWLEIEPSFDATELRTHGPQFVRKVELLPTREGLSQRDFIITHTATSFEIRVLWTDANGQQTRLSRVVNDPTATVSTAAAPKS